MGDSILEIKRVYILSHCTNESKSDEQYMFNAIHKANTAIKII